MARDGREGDAARSARLLGLGVVALVLAFGAMLIAINVYFRRHAGPEHAERRLAALGIDVAATWRAADAEADLLERVEVLLTDALRRGQRFEEVRQSVLPGTLAALGAPADGERWVHDASVEVIDWSVTLQARRRPTSEGGEEAVVRSVRVEPRRSALWLDAEETTPLAPGATPDDPAAREARRAARRAVAFLGRMREAGAEWPLAIAALGLGMKRDEAEASASAQAGTASADRSSEPGAGAGAPSTAAAEPFYPFALHGRRGWMVELLHPAVDAPRWVVIHEVAERLRRQRAIASMRGALANARAQTTNWEEAIGLLEPALAAFHAENPPFRCQISPLRPWQVAMLAPKDGEQEIARLWTNPGARPDRPRSPDRPAAPR